MIVQLRVLGLRDKGTLILCEVEVFAGWLKKKTKTYLNAALNPSTFYLPPVFEKRWEVLFW